MPSKSDALEVKDFTRAGPTGVPTRQRWWLAKDEREIADSIETHVKHLQQNQSSRIRQHVISARLYGSATLAGVSGLSHAQMLSQAGGSKERVTDNVIQSVIDTATARIGENKPKPYFLTSGGDYRQQRKAKRLNQFIEGIFYENRAYDLGGEAQRDCEIWGDGLIFVRERFERVVFERILPSEIWVDEIEGAYGRPRQAHWIRSVDREELAGWFPDKEAVIMRADKAILHERGESASAADMVTVRESWHLPSGPDADDGKHCVSIDGHLLDPLTKWEYDFFPWARFRWCPRPLGYWSQGIAERLQPKQLEINKLLWVIQRSMHMAGSYKVLIEDGSKIVEEHVNNQIGAIIKYRGTPPQWFVPQAVHPDYYAHLEKLVVSCYEREGISLQSATGVKPQGLNSGEAQRVYRDTVAERLKTQERYNERGFLELARLAIAIAKEIAERNGGHYKVSVPGKKFLQDVDWKEIQLDDDDYVMQCFPVSSLPKDPAGRLQTVTEYIQAGFITPRQGRRAMDFPDLESIESLANAEEDLLTGMLDDICEDGDEAFRPPEPTDNLQLCKELVLEYVARGRAESLDDDRLELLRVWSSQVDALMQMAQPPPPPMMPPGAGGPPGAAMPGGPQALPMPSPRSELLPNQPGQQ